jgi:hypothetical protein
LIQGYIKLRANFPTGCFGDIEKLNEFLVSAPLESFGNIRHDRDCCPPDLILQGEIFENFESLVS